MDYIYLCVDLVALDNCNRQAWCVPLLHESLHQLIKLRCLVRHVEAGDRLSESSDLLFDF